MKSSSSSSSSSKVGKRSAHPPSTAAKRSSSAASSSSSSSSAQRKVKSKPSQEEKSSSGKSETSSSTKATVESGRRLSKSTSILKLQGIPHSVSHKDVVSAVEQFGKTISVLLLRKVARATVCFEREEDAKAMRSCKEFRIKGFPVTVLTDKVNYSNEQKKLPEKKPAASTSTKSQTQKSTSSTTSTRKALLPTPKEPPLSLQTAPKKTAASTAKTVTTQKTSGKSSAKGSTSVTKAKVLVSKAKTTTVKQPTKTQTNKAAKGTVTKVKTKVTTVKVKSSAPKSKARENQPDVKDSKQKTVESPKPEKSETKGKDSPVKGDKDTAKASETTDVTVAESAKAAETTNVTVAETPKAAEPTDVTVSESKHQTEHDKAECEATESKEAKLMEAKLGETGVEAAEPMEVESVDEDKEAKPETKLETPEVADKVSAEQCNEKQPLTSTTEPESNVPPPECLPPPPQATETTPKSLDSMSQSPQTVIESSETSDQASAPEEPQSTLPDLESAVKELETKEESLETRQEETGSPTEAAVKETPKDTSEKELETTTLQKDPSPVVESEPDAPSTTKASTTVGEDSAVPAELPAPAKIQPPTDTTTATTTTTTTTTPVTDRKPAASTPGSVAVSMVKLKTRLLVLRPIKCININSWSASQSVTGDRSQLLITELPDRSYCRYIEEDIACLLTQFGFKYRVENIFVLPQEHMAFIQMPSKASLCKLFNRLQNKPLKLKLCTLNVHVITEDITMTLAGFYKCLMGLSAGEADMDKRNQHVVAVTNITPSESDHLMAALAKIGGVRNYLSLLKKAYIEFESAEDADRFGVWFSFLQPRPAYRILRLENPRSNTTAPAPKRPQDALPDTKEAVSEAAVPTAGVAVPPGSVGPFGVIMNVQPFIFPTASPWFHIPDYMTITGSDDIEVVVKRCTPRLPNMIMMTGLPEGNYTHEDVARLVWPYFLQQNIYHMYYNVIILPLQRRAFVLFTSWYKCCQFVRAHIKEPVSVGGCKLTLHFLLQRVHNRYIEQMMYKSLMKWSNSHVGDPQLLYERLLIVGISKMPSVDVIEKIMQMVSSIAPFASCLPLANRICFEMVSADDVNKVANKITSCLCAFKKQQKVKQEYQDIWPIITKSESIATLKKRLQKNSKERVPLSSAKLDNKGSSSAAGKKQTPPSPTVSSSQTESPGTAKPAGCKTSEPAATGPSATASSKSQRDVGAGEGRQPGSEIRMDTDVADKGAERAETIESEGSTPTVHDAAALGSLPLVNQDMFKALTAAVRQHRLARESQEQSRESRDKESDRGSRGTRSQKSKDSPQRESRSRRKSHKSEHTAPRKKRGSQVVDFTDDTFPDSCLFPDFDFSDFVTVDEVGDEVGDDVGDASSSCLSQSPSHSDDRSSAKTTSTSKQSPKSTKAEESSRSSSTAKQSSKEKESSKDSAKNSSSSSKQVSSKSTPPSNLSSGSVSSKTDKSKDSSEVTTSTTTTSTTTPPSSTSLSKTSASSSLPSTETPSSPAQKTQKKATTATDKSMKTSSACRTRSSSAATEMAKTTTATVPGLTDNATSTKEESHPAVQTKVDVCETLGEATAITEGAVAKSDQQMSAETTLAKSVESEAKMETSSEIQPSPQGEELGVAKQTHTGSSLLGKDAQDPFSPLESGSNEETLNKDLKETSEEDKNGAENPKEEEDESESYQILDSLDDQTGEEMDPGLVGDQDGNSETQLTEPQDSQTLDDETFEILDSVDDEGKACQEDDSEMEMDGAFQVLDSVIEDDTDIDQVDNQLVENDKGTVMQPCEEGMSQTSKSDKPTVEDTVGKEEETSEEDHPQAPDSVREQSPKTREDGKKRKQEGEEDKCKMAPTESSQDTNKAAKDNVEHKHGQTPNKDLRSLDLVKDEPLKDSESKDTVKTPESAVAEQETFQILDSVDQTTTEDNSRKQEPVLETPSGQIVEKDVRQIEEEEEEETYEVIDSVEDQPVTTDQSETDKKAKTTKKGEKTARKEEKPTKRSGPSTRASKSEEKPPKKEDRTVKKYDTRMKKSTATGASEREEEPEETMYQVVDSVEDEPVQDAVTAPTGSGRRRSERTKKEDKVTPNLTGPSEKVDRREEEEEEEEATYEILDSVEDDDPPTTARSDRGKRERTAKKEAKNDKIKMAQKEDTPTRKRHTPARDSSEGSREKTPRGREEDKVTKKESVSPKTSDVLVREVSEEEATYQILDSVEDEMVRDDPNVVEGSGGKGKKGRTKKKEVKTTKKDSTPLKKSDKDTSEKAVMDEEATYQVLDSLEDETINDDPTPAEQPEKGTRKRAQKSDKITKNDDKQTKSSDSLAGASETEKEEKEEEEEEPMYQVVDAVEDDQVHEDLNTTEESDRERTERRKTEDETIKKEDTPTRTRNTTMGTSEKEADKEEAVYEIVDSVEEDPTTTERSIRGRKERTPKKDAKKEDKSPKKSQTNLAPSASEKKEKTSKKDKRTEGNQTMSALVNLDEVSEEEEDYPDDTAEEEELRKRQAVAKEKQLAIEREREREERRAKERGEREKERERRSSSNSSSSSRGGRRRGVKERGREKEEEEEKVGVETKELVTLDEVGADGPEEEGGGGAPRSQETDGGITEGELQALVTLDEIIEEEEEQAKAEPSLPEPRPPSQESESGDSFNPETLVTLDETVCDEEEKKEEEQAEKTSGTVKRKLSIDDTEGRMNFVTVDEVGAEEEEEKEEEQAVTTTTKGRAKKRTRQTPVRKSTRGKQGSVKEEKEEEKAPPTADVTPPTSLDASSSLVKEEPVSSNDSQPEGASQPGLGDSSAEQDPKSPSTEGKEEEGGAKEGEEEKEEEAASSRAAIKVASKQRRQVVEREVKRSRSQSPSVPSDFKMPPFRPNNPLGLEFVVPKTGFFCNLCSVFYVNESTAKNIHCSSQKHYDNMEKYYQKCQEEQSRRSRGSSAPGSTSD